MRSSFLKVFYLFSLLPIDAMRIQWKFGLCPRNSNVHFHTFHAIENLAEIWPRNSMVHFYTFDAIENSGEI